MKEWQRFSNKQKQMQDWMNERVQCLIHIFIVRFSIFFFLNVNILLAEPEKWSKINHNIWTITNLNISYNFLSLRSFHNHTILNALSIVCTKCQREKKKKWEWKRVLKTWFQFVKCSDRLLWMWCVLKLKEKKDKSWTYKQYP